MKKTIAIRVSVGVAFLIIFISSWSQSGKADLGLLRLFSTAAFVCTLVFNIWDLWLWRIPWVQLLPGVPRNVRGTWKGVLTSLWIDPETGTTPPPKPAYLVMHQTASTITAKLLTDEARSISNLATVSQADSSFTLAYVYLNKPNMGVEHRSRMHNGSAILDLSGSPTIRIKGRYWTDRDSKGELEFLQRNKKTLADDYAEAEGLF
ncbi:hypothetical protein OHB14_29325 [Streptomyces sp. NBC_01613]|uniref:Cap15 family cyclic dinucleotide receptor domain-containing protein n=1 Tax=Streptomyces sp. NBC_01613 TaxID=2975896 RepID=UPI00386EBAAC